mmetsp:Transcript_1584/g.2789  ORF Transcript_1584/g.2789 Transcript_1584/m.2789 type:complete len:230 (-) Transcript_1584:905-1594(-)
MQDQDFDYTKLLNEQAVEASQACPPLFCFDTDTNTLYLKYIPQEIKRADLLKVLKENLNGFLHLSMSEPMRNHNFSRLAWVCFGSQEDCEQSLIKVPELSVDGIRLSAAPSHPNKKRVPVRICPPLPESAIDIDFELCSSLIKNVFDPEIKVESFVVDFVNNLDLSTLEKPKNEEDGAQPQPTNVKQLKLDILLLYLRRVHSFCFYCGEEYDDERMLSTRCGPQHIRNH